MYIIRNLHREMLPHLDPIIFLYIAHFFFIPHIPAPQHPFISHILRPLTLLCDTCCERKYKRNRRETVIMQTLLIKRLVEMCTASTDDLLPAQMRARYNFYFKYERTEFKSEIKGTM